MKWQIYIVTDSGEKVEHWCSCTRAQARAKIKDLRASSPHAKFKLEKR